jgi:predicted dehydrogenase
VSEAPLGLGIVGCGGAAADVCRAVASVPELSVVGLHDRDLALAEDLAQTTGGRAYVTLAELLASAAVQAVYVALPHDLLAPVAMQVLEAGRHVLVEKPMALSLADADALSALAARRGLTVGVFFEMRFAPVAVAAARLVREGAIGQVRAVRIRTLIDKSPEYWRIGLSGRSLNPWRGQAARAGGGVVLMNTSHQLDMVAAITGLDVTRVAGSVATTTAGIDVEDTAAAVLAFSNGAIGSIVAGAHVPGAIDDELIEIDGSLGQLTLEAYVGVLRLFLRQPFEDLPAGEWLDPEVGEGDAFAGALTAFAAAARAGTRPVVGVPEARQVLATILGLYRSSAEGRVIDL